MKILVFILLASFISACSLPPRPSDLEGIPVITYGQQAPAGEEFVLHFKAGQPINTNIKIHGNLFEKPETSTIAVKLKKDIYAYKNWVSSDRKIWVDGDSVLGIKLLVKIPGPKFPKPGLIDLSIFEK